jgi:hypothetical protein
MTLVITRGPGEFRKVRERRSAARWWRHADVFPRTAARRR